MFESVTYWHDDTQYTLPAEPTEHPQLYIAPTVRDRQVQDGWFLLHRPTGRCVGTSRPCGELRQIAGILVCGGLDWTSSDRAHYGDGTYGDAWMGAVREVEAVYPSPEVAPTTGNGIPRQALPLIESRLARVEWAANKSTSELIKLPDGSRNPQWRFLVDHLTSNYAIVYLLAALHRHDPYVADQVAASLADTWEAGETIEEWVSQWRDDLVAGRPLTLHGVPTPTPTDLLTPVQS